MRLNAGGQHVEALHSGMVAVGIVLCHLHGFQLLQTSLLGNFVLAFVGIVFQMTHIGNVAHIAHLVAKVLQIAINHIERDGRTGVAQVAVTIYRRSADIHTHATFGQRTE